MFVCVQYLTILMCLKVEVNEAEGLPTDKLTGDALDTSKVCITSIYTFVLMV